MGRVQLKRTDMIKRLRKRNFDYLYKHLSKFDDLVMPVSVKNADVCWFSFPLSSYNRKPLVAYLERRGIETRSMFSGNILKHPGYAAVTHRQVGDLSEANWILEHSFWVGVHPRMTQADREYMVKVFENYYASVA
jgi:dTDP-4-amino-4,6-dideoxygalactose transaminase